MLILAVNTAFAVIFALINMRYVISFEVAFVGAGLVFYSSYRAIMRKVEAMSGNLSLKMADSADDSKSADSADDFKNSAESKNSADSKNIADSKIIADSKNSAESTPNNLPKKERFFIGFRISFGLLRLLSYGLLGVGIIALINNGAFFLIPFLAGIALSTLTSALYVARKKSIAV